MPITPLYLIDALCCLEDVVTDCGGTKLGHRVENIDSCLHNYPILIGQHTLQCRHEPIPTKFGIEVGPVLELEREGVGTRLLKEIGQFSVAGLWYRVIF